MLTTNSHGLDIFKGYSKKEAAVHFRASFGEGLDSRMCGLGPRARRFLNLLCSFKHELGASGTRELPSTHPSALASARLGFELRGLARASCKAWREASSLDRDSWARLIIDSE